MFLFIFILFCFCKTFQYYPLFALSCICREDVSGTLVQQLTHNLKFKGLNPAAAAQKEHIPDQK